MKDLEKIPEYIRGEIQVHPVSTMEEVLFLALESPEKLFKDETRAKEIGVRLAIPGGNDSVASTPQTTM